MSKMCKAIYNSVCGWLVYIPRCYYCYYDSFCVLHTDLKYNCGGVIAKLRLYCSVDFIAAFTLGRVLHFLPRCVYIG